MISTRRIVAAVGLAAGLTGLAAPLASAAEAAAPGTGAINPMATLDSLTVSDLPAAHKAEIPRPSGQLQQLNRLNDLGQLHQLTDMAAPVTGLLGGIE
ncbi:hypothetical protein [Streptomyces griseorubiginosus]|uniref:hypothetical protein n=1 Tax=Streptomyces griseorubiginosus TaxID=67304 RepID=UPI001AD7433C|nr:hypothetical protein [Streptomyces griseorubiginosus]MBO4252947.1 hypothetical protein [Streptomyces griseorubiginosus]